MKDLEIERRAVNVWDVARISKIREEIFGDKGKFPS